MRNQPEIARAWQRFAAAMVLIAGGASVSADESFRLSFVEGRVSLTATAAPAAAILADWARQGGTRVEGALPAEPVTLELVDVPEQEALAVLLRGTPGYVAITRDAPSSNASRFERIIVMARRAPGAVTEQPVPAAPPAPAITQAPQFARPADSTGRVLGADGMPIPDDQDGAPPLGLQASPRGFSRGDEPTDDSRPPAPAPPAAGPIGSSVPGMVVPSPSSTPPKR